MEKLIIIDGNSLINRAYYALPPLAASNGRVYNAVFGFANILTRLILDNKPEYIVVAFDVARKTFRNYLYADYKGTRKPMPDELALQIPVLKDMLEKMNVRVLEKPGIEADDIIGTVAKRFNKVKRIILTGDRDCLQLIDDNTEVWLTKHGISEIATVNEHNLMTEMGLRPSQIIDMKSLMGDSSDNIPGVPGVGEKTAKDLLERFDTLEGVYAHLGEIGGRLQSKLQENEDLARISYKLATICTDVDVKCELEDCRYDFPFTEEVRDIFKTCEFRSLLKRTELFEGGESTPQPENNAENIPLELGALKKVIEENQNAPKIAILVEKGAINFAFDTNKNYQTNSEQIVKFKSLLENEKTFKVFYNKKQMLQVLKDAGIQLKGTAVDASLGMYLVNSNMHEDLPGYMFAHLGLPTTTMACSLIYTWELASKDLEEKNLNKLYYDIELPLVDVLFDMEQTGLKINMDIINELGPKYDRELSEIRERIYDYAGGEFNINSPKQLAKVLFDDLQLPDNWNKKHSTAVDVLSGLEGAHPIISELLRYRKIYKLQNTYVEGMRQYVHEDGKIHTVFNQTLVVTGRISSNEPNLQNIPIRTEEGRELRKMFIPSSKDNVLLSADYSQIELRLLAHYSQDPRLIEAYTKGEDIHTRTASEIFEVPFSQVTSDQRRTAKAVNFGIIYGISPYGLANNIGITANKAKEYIAKYFQTYPTIRTFLDSSVEKAKKDGFVSTLFGRIRNIELHSGNQRDNAFGERAAMNMPLQGTASDIIKLAMLNVYNEIKARKLKSKLILQIHDELILDVPKTELKEVKALVKDKMENVVKLNVPLNVDISSGESWFECK